MFDLFISHASEDKEAIARPLAQKLIESGLSVWYDEFSLSFGDSLSESIDKGLNQSDYGLVILSHNFFAKNWPKRELAGLVSRETIEGDKIILPVWHNLTAHEVLSYSPTLADRKALSTDHDFELITEAILRLVARPKWAARNSDNSEIIRDTSSLSILAHCFLGLQDLHKAIELFPDIAKSQAVMQLYKELIGQIAIIKDLPKIKDIFQNYHAPSIENPEDLFLISWHLILTIAQCKGADKFLDVNFEGLLKSRIKALSLFIPDEIKGLLNRVIEIKLFFCKVPKSSDSINISQTRLASGAYRYWTALKNIIIFQSQAPMGLNPHPLTRFITSMQGRIQESLTQITALDSSLLADIDTFCECLLSGDHDDLSEDEWTNGKLADIETAFEKLRDKLGPFQQSLSEPEENFLSVLSFHTENWKHDITQRWNRLLVRLEKERKQNSTEGNNETTAL
ncbi:MAG: toll/interleukin-1 receptor domain-containing protein [Chitinispirillaceae bacterium]|jgi:hypothetical protein